MTRRSLALAATAVFALVALPSTATAATGGALRPIANGCIVAAAPPPTGCVTGRAMVEFYPEIVVSPDGKHVYAVSNQTSAVTTFDRDAAGGLSQKPGAAGCRFDAEEPTPPAGCTSIANAGLRGASGVAISPGGENVYVTGDEEDGVNVFDRNLDTGVLTFEGCLGAAGTGCTAVRGTDSIYEITVSPDGKTVYTASRGATNNGSIAILPRNLSNGAIGQPVGATGCIANTNVEGCAVDTAIRFPREVLVSPDNNQVYVADANSQAVIAYNRDQTTGALTPVDRVTGGGCLAATNTYGGCVAYAPLSGSPENLAFSTDSTKIYVTSYYEKKLHTFARGANGGIAVIPGACITEVGTAACPGSAANMKNVYGIAVAPGNVYVATDEGRGVLTFDVGANGLPTAKEQPFGCVHATLAACTLVPGMTGMVDVVVSPDHRNVYAYGFNTLIGMARDAGPSCSPAAATVQAGQTVAVQLNCSDPDGDALAYEITSAPTSGVLAPPDAAGKATYAAAADAGGRSIAFSYRAKAFGGTSDVATGTITVTAPPPPPVVTPVPTVVPTPRILSPVSHTWRFTAKVTTVTGLSAATVPAGATIALKCTIKGKRKRCPFKTLTKKVTKAGKVNLLPMIKKKKRKFRVGAKLELRITAPGYIGKVVTFTMRKSKVPSTTPGCIPLNSKRILRICP